MQAEYRCTTTCVHGRRYVIGELVTGEESELPHDTSGKLIHFVKVEGSTAQNAINSELVLLRKELADLKAGLDGASAVDDGPTKKEIMAELDELGIPYKSVQNKTELAALLAAAKQ